MATLMKLEPQIENYSSFMYREVLAAVRREKTMEVLPSQLKEFLDSENESFERKLKRIELYVHNKGKAVCELERRTRLTILSYFANFADPD